MSIGNSNPSMLVLTVGTGNVKDLEHSIYAPLLKSIETGSWEHVVLLSSQVTVCQAKKLKDRIPEISVDIRQIPGKGSENDVDACFAHFDEVLGEIIASGYDPANITLDFTRGTKAMSAALVLAGVGRRVPVLRYIQGDRDSTGTVIAGTEEIREVRTEVASARQRLDLAEHLMRRGPFEAVRTLIENGGSTQSDLPESLQSRLKAYGSAAAIYAAWDRFDYEGAVRLAAMFCERARFAQRFAPTEAMEHWITTLSQKLDKSDHMKAAEYLRHLACDVLASAERRVRDGHWEDAAIRCYRVLELVGQIRLFDRGYNSACLPADDCKVADYQAKLKKKKSHPLRKNTRKDLRGTLAASRRQVAGLLKSMGDPVAKKLLEFEKSFEEHIKARNEGILIHGFTAMSPELRAQLHTYIKTLEELLDSDDPEAARRRLTVARSLDFSRA